MLPDAAQAGSSDARSPFGLCDAMGSMNRPVVLGFRTSIAEPRSGGGDGYPPFDIERFPATAERGAVLRITLAVAGFAADDLEVSIAHNQLVIRGSQADERERNYLYRGIAARRFQRSFVLKDGVEVVNAGLNDGLLSIELAEPLEGESTRKIEIDTAG